MLDLTPRERKLLEGAGPPRFPTSIIWVGIGLGSTGAILQVVKAFLERPSPDWQGIFLGVVLAAYFLGLGGALVRIAELQSLVAKLRDERVRDERPA